MSDQKARDFWIKGDYAFSNEPANVGKVIHVREVLPSEPPMKLKDEAVRLYLNGRIQVLEADRDKWRGIAAKLVETLKYYASEKNWYYPNSEPKSKQRMVIGSIDTEGDDWIGGHAARIALKEYEQASAPEGEK